MKKTLIVIIIVLALLIGWMLWTNIFHDEYIEIIIKDVKITDVYHIPEKPTSKDKITIIAKIKANITILGDYRIKERNISIPVTYVCSRTGSKTMLRHNNETYVCTIGPFPDGTKGFYIVGAMNCTIISKRDSKKPFVTNCRWILSEEKYFRVNLSENFTESISIVNVSFEPKKQTLGKTMKFSATIESQYNLTLVKFLHVEFCDNGFSGGGSADMVLEDSTHYIYLYNPPSRCKECIVGYKIVAKDSTGNYSETKLMWLKI